MTEQIFEFRKCYDLMQIVSFFSPLFIFLGTFALFSIDKNRMHIIVDDKMLR